ncbi:MAG: site-2 protease family protein [Minisyncoccia bacterium]
MLEIFGLIVLIFSVVLHEISHGLVAEKLGDPTAKLAGRLTLNPLPHIDLFGSIILPALLILTHSPVILGWAKPVPYNPMLLTKDPKYGPAKVALAGPAVNLLLAIVFGLFLRLIPNLPNISIILIGDIVFINLLLGLFNLIPIPPLDGSKVLSLFLPQKYLWQLESFGLVGFILIFITLFFFSNFIFVAVNFLFKLLTGFPI